MASRRREDSLPMVQTAALRTINMWILELDCDTLSSIPSKIEFYWWWPRALHSKGGAFPLFFLHAKRCFG